ncbi:MAG: NAD-glutamate dehydrogenase [Gammaproteobacteria bacterium]|nr:NAD-glutamate dehydrogenase [Gammaproteobacteria bacterium]
MNRQSADAKDEILAEVLALVRVRIAAEQYGQIEAFVRQFFLQVDPDDLAGRDPVDLYGAVVSQWLFARQLAAQTAKVRVYNPRVEEHGWQCPHTVIETTTGNMPFLVDSVRMEVNAQGFATHLIIHPVMRVRRDAAGVLLEVLQRDGAGEGAQFDSFMHLEIDRETDPDAIERLEEALLRVLADVRAAVDDWQPMLARMRATAAAITAQPPPLPDEEISEGVAFLDWLNADHFTFLGCRDYDLTTADGEDVLRTVPGSGLGILRQAQAEATSTSFATLPAEIRDRARRPELLIVTKSNTRATVHRPVHMDYVGVKRFDDGGNVVGERRFLGLYTSVAYSASALQIPMLRRKIKSVIERSGVLPGSHMSKTLLTILESYPRDELFQIEADELLRTAMGILHLQERQRTRLFVRRDSFGRYFSCLVYVPRDNYNTDVRERMQQLLMNAFAGVSTEFSANLSESILARVLIVVYTTPGVRPDYDERELEAKLVRVVRSWEDDLADALVERLGEERGVDLYKKYARAFPAGYREDCPARVAVHDIELMEQLKSDHGLALNLYVPLEARAGELRFKLFRSRAAVPLSHSVPMLEHMGVRVIDERPYEIEPRDAPPVWIHDMGLSTGAGPAIDIDDIRDVFKEAFQRIWHDEAESDDFNRLVLLAGLGWREITLLRALARYSRQAGFTFSQAYMQAALAAHPQIVRQLLALFIERHDPRRGEPAQERGAALVAQIEQALDAVPSLDEDRILRRFLALILAVTRTNYFQTGADGAAKPYLSIKLDPSKVPGLPEPRPMFEIYVYSPRVEGVHLRGGKVARGGLRWSDRMEDFRTEVLGLMKAQMVKNAVIVPVGAKGGFVVKMPPAGERDALMQEVVSCYRTFLRGLLDLTDNQSGGKVVPPPDVVRHDQDDTYLVVAADKGTATFSDIANAVAAEYGFWLEDAFASGGSSGYDHKKMGITARGAWESVKKHFRTLGIDVQSTDFSVVGIGDMSGDVFGNGMLLSTHIRLLAAFDHRHVFLDPDPDPHVSFEERKRLFELPRSSWADYDASLISGGGGVFPRTAKSIPLSPEAGRALGIDARALTPSDLIRAILRAPVDLLYNGGIGTYVKAGAEAHAEAGDRSNDAIRIDACELRCRVVGEGGNLGFTQRARIEYALRGGLIHTDAIDNSAGVDCSDHEVNIKILLNTAVAAGDLTLRQRNELLETMTGEVAALVLRDNCYQAQSLAISGALGAGQLDAQARFMRYLEHHGRLKRKIEFLPADEELAARKAARTGLTSPERAVLLAYSKIWLYSELVESDVPEEPYVATALTRYFPAILGERFGAAIRRHPLQREIIATHVTNSMINRVGSTFVHRLMEETGAQPPEVVRAYLLARQTFGMVDVWNAIDALDNQIEDRVQTAMLIRIGRLILRATLWFLRRRLYAGELEPTIARYSASVAAVCDDLDARLGEQDRAHVRQAADDLLAAGVPAALAARVAGSELAFSALDISEVSHSTGRGIPCVAAVYFSLAARLSFTWMREQIGILPGDTHWQARARAALRDELAEKLRSLTAVVLKRDPAVADPDALIGAWEQANDRALGRTRQVLAEIEAASVPDLAMLSVGLRELRNLA